MLGSWKIIKRTFASFSSSWKRHSPETTSRKVKAINNYNPDQIHSSDEPNDNSSILEPALKKRRVTLSQSTSPVSVFEPRIFEGDFPPIEPQVNEDHGSCSSIFSGLSKDLDLFLTTKEDLGTQTTSENPETKDIEIPMRNPRRRLHQVASKFKRSSSKTPVASGQKKNRYSSSHFSFDASEAAPLFRPAPPPDFKPNLVREPSVNIPCSRVIQLASDINLDENAVGSLLVILNEDASKK